MRWNAKPRLSISATESLPPYWNYVGWGGSKVRLGLALAVRRGYVSGMPESNMTVRQKVARGLYLTLTLPVVVPLQLFCTPPMPGWIFGYTDVVAKAITPLAGPGGFRLG